MTHSVFVDDDDDRGICLRILLLWLYTRKLAPPPLFFMRTTLGGVCPFSVPAICFSLDLL